MRRISRFFASNPIHWLLLAHFFPVSLSLSLSLSVSLRAEVRTGGTDLLPVHWTVKKTYMRLRQEKVDTRTDSGYFEPTWTVTGGRMDEPIQSAKGKKQRQRTTQLTRRGKSFTHHRKWKHSSLPLSFSFFLSLSLQAYICQCFTLVISGLKWNGEFTQALTCWSLTAQHFSDPMMVHCATVGWTQRERWGREMQLPSPCHFNTLDTHFYFTFEFVFPVYSYDYRSGVKSLLTFLALFTLVEKDKETKSIPEWNREMRRREREKKVQYQLMDESQVQ